MKTDVQIACAKEPTHHVRNNDNVPRAECPKSLNKEGRTESCSWPLKLIVVTIISPSWTWIILPSFDLVNPITRSFFGFLSIWTLLELEPWATAVPVTKSRDISRTPLYLRSTCWTGKSRSFPTTAALISLWCYTGVEPSSSTQENTRLASTARFLPLNAISAEGN